MEDVERWRVRHERRSARKRARGFDHRVVLAYDGPAFAGYARQPERDTVEAALREALEPVAPGLRRMAVAGRTDRGVSAVGQVVSFRADRLLPPTAIEAAVDGVRRGHLACLEASPTRSGFHAQFEAEARYYAYLYSGPYRDLAAMDRRLARLEGRRCFARFGREMPEGQTTVRRLLRARCRPGHLEDAPVVVFELAATGFLRRMVRVLVAESLHADAEGAPDEALLAVAEGRRAPAPVPPAPPEGLRFERVGYPAVIDPRSNRR